MIAVTVLAVTLISLCIAAAALLLERACIALDLPRRWTWLWAMLLMCLVPLLPDTFRTPPPASRLSLTVIPAVGDVVSATAGLDDARLSERPHSLLAPLDDAVSATTTLLSPLDGPLLLLWCLVSATLVGFTVRSAQRLARMQRSWVTLQRDGITAPAVWVSDDIGPAAYGVIRGEVVIPRWAMSLPPLDRRLMLLHERSHVAANDPRLIAYGMAMLILVPWNIPLRWAFRRLQRAIEHDCDRRVLHRPALARRYAALLLHVAERCVAGPPWQQRALATGGASVSMISLLSCSRDLEARLRSLAQRPVTMWSRLRAWVSVGAAAQLAMLAAAVPLPSRARDERTLQPLRSNETSSVSVTRDPEWVSRRVDARHGPRVHADYDSAYFAWGDSLVMSALVRSAPSLLKLATTETPYVAIALSERNEILAHSIRAGLPAGDSVDGNTLHERAARAAATVGLTERAHQEREFSRRMALMSTDKGRAEDLGVSHLRVGAQPLTVMWVRFKTSVRF